jgi:hypothetical protein
MDAEEWRKCPSLPEYFVSSRGRIMREPFEGPMPRGGARRYGGKPGLGQWAPEGRYIFAFRGHSYKVHQLVCEAFHGPAPFPRAVVMHGDENPRNNRADNLRWGTQKENMNAPGYLTYCRNRVGERSSYAVWRCKLRAELADMLS